MFAGLFGDAVVAYGILEFSNTNDNQRIASIKEIFVLKDARSVGVGESVIASMTNEAIEHNARAIGLRRLMALTYVPDFFARLGYGIVPMNTLPEKVFGVCVTCPKFRACDEIAVVKHLD